VVSFVNIEGNVAPEDCFLSRQIFSHAHQDPSAFLEALAARAAVAPRYASALFSTALHVKVRAGAVKSIFESIVDLSDNGDLMAKFLELPMPRTFMYGEQNANLTYLRHLERSGVSLAEIPHCGHFPMYSNAPAMWRQVLGCQARGYGWMGGVH
jgi:pimeloyl-ACP methyl ester carboxylesterase